MPSRVRTEWYIAFGNKGVAGMTNLKLQKTLRTRYREQKQNCRNMDRSFAHFFGENEVSHGCAVREDARPLTVEVPFHLTEIFRGEEQSEDLLQHLHQQRATVPAHRLDALVQRAG